MKARHRNRINADALGRLDQLPAMLRAERSRRELSQRQAAAEIGIGFSTVARVENGGWPDAPGFLAIIAWLGVPGDWFLASDKNQDAYRRGWDDCATAVRAAMQQPARDGGDCPCGCPAAEGCYCGQGCGCDPCQYCDRNADWEALTGQPAQDGGRE